MSVQRAWMVDTLIFDFFPMLDLTRDLRLVKWHEISGFGPYRSRDFWGRKESLVLRCRCIGRAWRQEKILFEELRAVITQRIHDLPIGSRFNLRDLLCGHWPDDPGAARQLGRAFYAHLSDFPEAKYELRDGANLHWYIRFSQDGWAEINVAKLMPRVCFTATLWIVLRQ